MVIFGFLSMRACRQYKQAHQPGTVQRPYVFALNNSGAIQQELLGIQVYVRK